MHTACHAYQTAQTLSDDSHLKACKNSLGPCPVLLYGRRRRLVNRAPSTARAASLATRGASLLM
eukprot:6157812-Pleurochrysis_carterae.AAC.5